MKKNQKGGVNIVSASIEMVDSMIDLGHSIFTEIKEITEMKSQLSHGSAPSSGIPNQSTSSPSFTAPKL